MLYAQGFYRDACGAKASTCAPAMSTKCCDRQFVRFSLVTSVSFFLVDAAAAPWGELADRAGGRVCLGWAGSISVFGFAALSFGAYFRVDVMIVLGIMALGTAGPGEKFTR